MKLIDLTMPLWEGNPIGQTFPMDTPFRIETHLSYETNGYWMYSMTIDVEGGTCFMQPSQNIKYRDTYYKLDTVPIEELVLRETCVLTVPKKAGEKVLLPDVEKALARADLHEGDAVLLRTGWGDGEKYFSMGDDYVLKTPHYAREAAVKLAEELKKKRCNLFMTDTALLGYPDKHFIPEWCSRRPKPKSWPSPEAREYLKTYDRKKMTEDWNTFDAFPPAGIAVCKCVVNCGAISRERIKIIVLPLKIRGAPSSTCRIVAVEG